MSKFSKKDFKENRDNLIDKLKSLNIDDYNDSMDKDSLDEVFALVKEIQRRMSLFQHDDLSPLRKKISEQAQELLKQQRKDNPKKPNQVDRLNLRADTQESETKRLKEIVARLEKKIKDLSKDNPE